MEGYLDPKQLSQKLSVKIGTIYSWVSRGKIPFEKFNGLTRFNEKEIEEWHRAQEEERKRKNFEL